ncbi:hypothetical protein ANCDUO_09249 [Ancylostoma duodenale]|uniref:Receptor ligand binding region domain-containing protein n=1 Tax=Ancylostoma duodenale TaxID=51022 RepID=A0A0C2GN54_9BILA|nr:hypothetical protein ANCDUO_09249 [Ancylostoma duodenale]
MDAVARMAAFWNIPIIGYMAASNSLSDKKAYPTLARVSIMFDEWADSKAMIASGLLHELKNSARSE